MKKLGLAVLLSQVLAVPMVLAQTSTSDSELIKKLLERIDALEARLKSVEGQQSGTGAPSPSPTPTLNPASPAVAAQQPPVPASGAAPAEPAAPEPAAADSQTHDSGGHDMSLPFGPVLHIRGFFDFNAGVGSIANPLVFPVIDNGCGTCGNPATPPHTGFQAGEFDLLFSSKLSEHLSFLAEVVLGPDATNVFGLDIERYQLTYRKNRYFSASAGRFHTSIGYYNTAYHHGNWFSTAEGRPIMYLFEDSGGILPVHMVGATFTGEVPNTEKLGLHWVAEVGNGNSSNPSTIAIQNFNSDRNYKATNLAFYIKPEVAPGLQIGGSWYHDGLNPSQAEIPLPLPPLRQNVGSGYLVYFSSNWEVMNEAVLLSNRLIGTESPFRSTMAYSQLARKFGIYRPYFRYQYVNDNRNDPINILKGIYYGPSAGVRIDFTEFAAFKLQFNHLYQSNQLAGNGLNAQLAFTF